MGQLEKNNLLDLQFTNDQELSLDHEILENILFSDHCICILNTNLEPKSITETNVNYYTSDIPNYNLMEASEIDWEKINESLKKIDWENIFNDKNEFEITEILIKIIENSVRDTMKSRSREKRTHDNNGNKFNSNNLIPKAVRKLFRKKCKISKQIKTVKNVKQCSKLRNDILKIDIELKNHYKSRRESVEQKIFTKSKENKNVLYHYIKSKSKR